MNPKETTKIHKTSRTGAKTMRVKAAVATEGVY